MKKILCLFLVLIFLWSTLLGCNDTSDINVDDTSDDTEETTSDTSKIQNTEPFVLESPVEDFEYEVNENGGITITKYIGNETNIVIPSKIDNKNVTDIGAFAFTANDNIIYLKIPSSVISVKNSAFWHCSSLTTVILSQNLTELQASVFEDCSALTDIELPESLTQIGSRAFANCSSLKYIEIKSNCINEYSWMAFDSSGLEAVLLPNGIEILPNRIFFNTNITDIVLPSTVKEIDVRAFGNCYELESITLNDGLTTIDTEAFSSSKLVEIVIPQTVEHITELVFLNCESLQKVKFEGNAPDTYIKSALEGVYVSPGNVHYTIYYHSTAEGFTSSEWYGYQTEIW